MILLIMAVLLYLSNIVYIDINVTILLLLLLEYCMLLLFWLPVLRDIILLKYYIIENGSMKWRYCDAAIETVRYGVWLTIYYCNLSIALLSRENDRWEKYYYKSSKVQR